MLFRPELGAGAHTGPAGRFGRLGYEAEILAFIVAVARAVDRAGGESYGFTMVTVKPDDDGLSPIVFYLDRGSGVPTYLQFVHQVDYALRLGFLRVGDQLPRIKDVTRTLAVNPDTVMKAYRELELRGVAAGLPGWARSSCRRRTSRA